MLAIIWHSRTGGAQAMAMAALEGACGGDGDSDGEGARLIRAADARPDDFLAASGFLFACPENLASITGMMKEMFDRCYYPLLGRIEGRPYATMIAAGSDGSGAQAQIDRIVTGWRLRRVAAPLIVNFSAQTPAAIQAAKQLHAQDRDACSALGAALSEGIRLGIF